MQDSTGGVAHLYRRTLLSQGLRLFSHPVRVYSVHVTSHAWRSIARWLLAVLVCPASLMAAIVALMLTSILLPQTCIRWANAIHLPLPVGIYLSLLDLMT